MYLEKRAARLGLDVIEADVAVVSDKDSSEEKVDPQILKDVTATAIVAQI